MTREEFNQLPSTTKVPCPDCGKYSTHPQPGCNCRGASGIENKPHIFRNHHSCPKVKDV